MIRSTAFHIYKQPMLLQNLCEQFGYGMGLPRRDRVTHLRILRNLQLPPMRTGRLPPEKLK